MNHVRSAIRYMDQKRIALISLSLKPFTLPNSKFFAVINEENTIVVSLVYKGVGGMPTWGVIHE